MKHPALLITRENENRKIQERNMKIRKSLTEPAMKTFSV